MALTKQKFTSYLRDADFRTLFIEEMGWNKVSSSYAALPTFYVDEAPFFLKAIAHRNGFQVLVCDVPELPSTSTCKKLDTKLRKAANDYICIFVITGTEHHQWVAPVKTNEKRDIVIIEYSEAEKAQFLFEKISGLSFAIDEVTTIVDVKERIQEAFALNSERITKDFYIGFNKEHKTFAKYITGIDDQVETKDNKNKQWYTSVMLNRLMFCYFIQKKGFLNGDENYLRNKLRWVQEQRGNDKFFKTFYKGFLIHLFHRGLNSPIHDDVFEDLYGRIPYLNGGMFDDHQIEREYADIDIRDEAFESLFEFFDKWRWHLDTRMTASGKDINPDVLGYIFEQYINDRAQMGAYYTKEDITEYIGRNTIIPYLFVAVSKQYPEAFEPHAPFWSFLRSHAEDFIYDTMKKGVNETIPDEIASGIDILAPNLLERRVHWNRQTPCVFGLPTEIWRETIERFQRYHSILDKLQGGEINCFNDFITYNLNTPRIAYDFINATDDRKFIEVFYGELLKITILDPTCGSGAFLFAALNLLEPLYEVCISRMEEFNAQDQHAFVYQLAEIKNKYRSNIQYFIYKSIILRNLYGVDIMAEAVEIAKLRLFLKMVAVVDVDKKADNLGLDPLPDVDFNIRCGNTLVGYATEEQLIKDLNFDSSLEAMLANQELKDRLDAKLSDVADTYEIFRLEQFEKESDITTLKDAKQSLSNSLDELNDLLNRHLFAVSGLPCYEQWRLSHQPFHWLAEYYQIMHDRKGFDVIIGNPPYVEYNKKVNGVAISDIYSLDGYKTIECGNLYAYVMERSSQIIRKEGYMSMIVPLSGHSTARMSPLVTHFYNAFNYHIHLNLSADANPQRLFDGVKFRLTIFNVSQNGAGVYSSKYTRWYAEERPFLFTALVNYNEVSGFEYQNIIPKVPNRLFVSAVNKVKQQKPFFYCFPGENKLLYHNAPVNWIRSHSFVPFFRSERDGEGVTTQLKTVYFDDIQKVKIGSAILNSTLFFIWWVCTSDCYHLNIPEIQNFHYSLFPIDDQRLCKLSDTLSLDMKKNSVRRVYTYQTSGRVEYDEFYMKLSKSILNSIDCVLGNHYGFSEEELDYIINYDIKYRMGDELFD